MKITFLGAAQMVTGSCYLVETDEISFLVDCGLFQGSAQEEALNKTPFAFAVSDLDFVLLSHAHIDHSGRIPQLYRAGYRGPVYATKATTDLCWIMLPDSGHIQEKEQEWLNRKAMRAGLAAQEPIYTMQDALDACALFKPYKYDVSFAPHEHVRVRFRDAGHILGSAIVEIWLTDRQVVKKIVFSGDLGNLDMPILRDPTVIDKADYLILESTYADRLHHRIDDEISRFVELITDTYDRGGNVIIPSFAVGRTQEVIYQLFKEEEKYRERREKFLKIPVYIDSPLATSATSVFRQNTDCYDEEASSYIADGKNPLDFSALHFTQSVDESKWLNEDPASKIIISASGMCDAGRIKHHLKHNLWRADSTVILVGFQARGSLGRRLVDGAKSVNIFNDTINVKAKIALIEGFSGHADRAGLISWLEQMTEKPAEICLVHGEPESMRSFSRLVSEKMAVKLHCPQLNETITLGEPVARVRTTSYRDPRRMTAIYALDQMQINFIETLEAQKRQLIQAKTREDVDQILDLLPPEVQKIVLGAENSPEPDNLATP